MTTSTRYPQARSRRILLIAAPNPMPSLRQRQTRTASPPTPVGSTWLKNSPTNTILSNVPAPGEGTSADRMRCQRSDTKKFAANSATSVAAKSGSEAWPMISAARPKSTRVAKAHNSPAVAKSRMLVIRILRMVITPD